jgi:hypothetical protein
MNMTPNDPRTEASTCKSSGTQPENGEAWIARIQALTVKETTSKAHMQVHTNKESRENRGGNRGRTGLKRAWVDRPKPAHSGPGSDPRCSSTYCLFLRPPPHQTNILPTSFTRKLPPQDEGESWMSSSQGSTPAEGRKQEEDSKPLA